MLLQISIQNTTQRYYSNILLKNNKMDLSQRKLIKNEWDSIEIPVNSHEKKILNMITRGFKNVLIKENDKHSLLSFMKIPYSEMIDDYLFENYFQKDLDNLCNTYNLEKVKIKKSKKKLKKADIIRLKHNEKTISTTKHNLYEFILLNYFQKMLQYKKSKNDNWYGCYYILNKLFHLTIQNPNQHVITFIKNVLKQDIFQKKLSIKYFMRNAPYYLEKDGVLQKNADRCLYDHQKELFTVCKQYGPKLILYIAPTGTGKTMSPLGLSESYKIIFVCAVRHVGLALAKSAISIEKKVAFAFGCKDVTDIRLHYFAAKDFTRDRRSGQIRHVDSTIGDNVEIMITDIQSYLYAMYYMKSFNSLENIIVYWDEPTITMDYPTHEFHDIIKKNWNDNVIPNMVLSSATLPHEEEIVSTLMSFREKFPGAETISIISHDCKKTIPIINKEGYKEMPHYLFDDYKTVKKSAKHCLNNKTLLRHLDIQCCVDFVLYANKHDLIKSDRYKLDVYFESMDDISMKSVKTYYLDVLSNLKKDKEAWEKIKTKMNDIREKRYKSTILLTTNDAKTITCGPAIYLAEDVKKIAKFCIQKANIPSKVMEDIQSNLEFNKALNEKISILEKAFEDGTNKDEGKEKKMGDDNRLSSEMKQLMEKIKQLQSMIKQVALNEMFVPNSKEHLKRFDYMKNNIGNVNIFNFPFTSNITEENVEKIMLVQDIEDEYKLLLLMGIGVFDNHKSRVYTEIMKQMAENQQLYLIIASSDYIYGTNYQFCHGYLGKDLENMTQEKCIQALGRIGRTRLQQDYSIRFRDNDLLKKLFQKVPDNEKIEVLNMNKLFS